MGVNTESNNADVFSLLLLLLYICYSLSYIYMILILIKKRNILFLLINWYAYKALRMEIVSI